MSGDFDRDFFSGLLCGGVLAAAVWALIALAYWRATA